VSHHELWASAIDAVGVLDCLMALAGAALSADGDMCRPVILPHPTTADGSPAGGVLRARQLRHPAGIGSAAGGGSFVPNDIALGGEAPGFILLTGPNMVSGVVVCLGVADWLEPVLTGWGDTACVRPAHADDGACCTAPLQGGKSTLLRQVCLAAVLAQVRVAALCDGPEHGLPACTAASAVLHSRTPTRVLRARHALQITRLARWCLRRAWS
jgi:hypothetical protein